MYQLALHSNCCQKLQTHDENLIIFKNPNLFYNHILNTPNLVFSCGAFNDADILNPNTVLVSTGSITPSSHNLKIK